MQIFKARAAAAVELADLNAFAVVLSEETDGTGMRLEIQKALSFDDQDRISGQDTYCLCTEAGASHYGGVVSWTLLLGANLQLVLDTEAANALEVNGGFLIEVSSTTNVAELRIGLERLLGPEA